jgi:serine/threonine-protein kinase
MTQERWAAIERLYHAAVTLDVRERAVYLAEACAGDEELRREVESLLNRAAAADGFLNQPTNAWVPQIVSKCPACSRDIADAAALQCPYCSTLLAESDTRAAPGLPASGARRDRGGRESVLHGSQFGPLDDACFAPGRIFASRYRIVSLLGRGAMGEVYRAEDLKLGQPVALKLLVAHVARGLDGLRRFVSEVRLARGIAHPNVCRVYDIGEAEEWHYLSMEYVDGETLASLQSRIGRLPSEKALDIARQLCAGLAAAHDRSVLHRDLKPSNIMIDGRGRVRIMDFGLAVPAAEGSVHEVAGTPAYMAPEQFVGDRVTERTDLYALGLVLYELFTGRRVFAASTLEERMRLAFKPPVVELGPGIDPRLAEIVAACLESDPAKRPRGALAVATVLPGGDPLAAALADGRLLAPEMIAAAAKTGGLRSAVAWTLLAGVVGGTLLVASRAELLTFSPSDVPKPPEVLAERSRDILVKVGHVADVRDSEFAFHTATDYAQSMPLRFVYRQSPQHLVPRNMFHAVTESDPPADVYGMATVTLDPSGRLIGFSRISDAGQRETPPTMTWTDIFGEAGLAEEDFVRVESGRKPLVPHDTLVTWTARLEGSSPPRVSAGVLGGLPVYFEVADPTAGAMARRSVLSTQRTPAAEALLWILAMFAFAAMTVMARRNLRAGEGDLTGARKLSLVVGSGGVLSAILHAHHVPDPVEEIGLVLGAGGWALVWGGFCWLAYISFEPHVRRLWSGTLISWTRLLAGRVRDPLVGRDVVAGLLAGITIVLARMLQLWFAGRGAPTLLVVPALEALRSTRHFTNIILFEVIDGLQFAVGGLFLLLLLRLVLRKTWIAAGVFLALCTPLLAGSSSAAPDLVFGAATASLFMTITLRVGLLAGIVMVCSERLLTRLPITLNLNAWYLESSVMVLLLVLAAAIYGFIVTLSGRPAFGAKAPSA